MTLSPSCLDLSLCPIFSQPPSIDSFFSLLIVMVFQKPNPQSCYITQNTPPGQSSHSRVCIYTQILMNHKCVSLLVPLFCPPESSLLNRPQVQRVCMLTMDPTVIHSPVHAFPTWHYIYPVSKAGRPEIILHSYLSINSSNPGMNSYQLYPQTALNSASIIHPHHQ